jgi:hypothetical protein
VYYVWDLDGDGGYGNDRGELDGYVDTPSLPCTQADVVAYDDNGNKAWDSASILSPDNTPPAAYAGGSYVVVQGHSISLHGSASDPGRDFNDSSFEWDLDGDGIFGETGIVAAPSGDEVGPTPTFWAADRPDTNSTITVRLRVRDFWGAVTEDTAAIQVTSYGEGDPLVHISPDHNLNEGGYVTAWTSGPPGFASAYNDVNVYLWDLDGDGLYGNDPGESGKYLRFNLPGEYLVSVVATVPSGQYYRARTSATIQVDNVAPTLAAPASAGSNPVTTTHTTLSVLGADAAGEANLSYSWSTIDKPLLADDPFFSINDCNLAKNTTVNFSAPGSYTFRATIEDAWGLFATSDVTVNIQRTITRVTVSPSTATVAPQDTQQFAALAKDQFGVTVTSAAFAWAVQEGVGTINAGSGLYTAGVIDGLPHSVVVAATASGTNVMGTARITISGLAHYQVTLGAPEKYNPESPDFTGGLTVSDPGWIVAESYEHALNHDVIGSVTYYDPIQETDVTSTFDWGSPTHDPGLFTRSLMLAWK